MPQQSSYDKVLSPSSELATVDDGRSGIIPSEAETDGNKSRSKLNKKLLVSGIIALVAAVVIIGTTFAFTDSATARAPDQPGSLSDFADIGGQQQESGVEGAVSPVDAQKRAEANLAMMPDGGAIMVAPGNLQGGLPILNSVDLGETVGPGGLMLEANNMVEFSANLVKACGQPLMQMLMRGTWSTSAAASNGVTPMANGGLNAGVTNGANGGLNVGVTTGVSNGGNTNGRTVNSQPMSGRFGQAGVIMNNAIVNGLACACECKQLSSRSYSYSGRSSSQGSSYRKLEDFSSSESRYSSDDDDDDSWYGGERSYGGRSRSTNNFTKKLCACLCTALPTMPISQSQPRVQSIGRASGSLTSGMTGVPRPPLNPITSGSTNAVPPMK